jgi:uncharacterized membrane protein
MEASNYLWNMFHFMESLKAISQIIGIASIVILIFGSVHAIVVFLLNELKRMGGKFDLEKIASIRIQLGQYLLLGFELLIVSDVIATIVEPTIDELIQVGGVVVIRTVLSFFLNREIEAQKKHGSM